MTAPSVVLIHRYFKPDSPPYAHMLAAMADAIAESGCDVRVLTAQPSYGDSRMHERAPKLEQIGPVLVRRLPLLPERKGQIGRRVLNLVFFAVQVWLQIMTGPRADIIMAATTPPLLVAKAASSAATLRRSKFVYHNQDIYPEVLGSASGRLRAAATSCLRYLDTRTGRASDIVVVLSRDMTESWRLRGLVGSKLRVINNFDPVEPTERIDVESVPPGVRRIVFAGNVGHFQDVPALVAAVERVGTDQVELVIVGDGAELEASRKQAHTRTRFVGRVSPAEAAGWVESADLAVVSLTEGLIRFVYPSKTFAYLSVGTPVLVRVEADSELAQMVLGSRIGWVADPRQPEVLDGALRAFLAAEDQELRAMSDRANRLAEDHSPANVLRQWTDLFHEIGAS